MIMNQKAGKLDNELFKLALKIGLIPTLDDDNNAIIYDGNLRIVVDGRLLRYQN